MPWRHRLRGARRAAEARVGVGGDVALARPSSPWSGRRLAARAPPSRARYACRSFTPMGAKSPRPRIARRPARRVPGTRVDGMPLLWVRDLATGESRALPAPRMRPCPSGRRIRATWGSSPADLEARVGGGRPCPRGDDNVGTLARRRRMGRRRHDCVQRADGLMPVHGSGGAPTATKLPSQDWGPLAKLPAGRPTVPVHREAVDPYCGSQRTGHLSGVAGQPDDSATPSRPVERGYAPPGYLVFAREGRSWRRLRSGRGTRHRPAGRDRRGRATDHSSTSPPFPRQPTGRLAVRPPPAVAPITAEIERVQCGIASGRPRRREHSRRHRALYFYLMALSPERLARWPPILDPRAGTQDLWLLDLAKDSSCR